MIKKILSQILEFQNNKVFKNVLTVAIITLLISFLGFYKEVLVASSFGLSITLDTFFIAILIPGFIQNVFIGAFKNVFIPNYIAELETGNELSSFQGTGLALTSAISFIFILIAFLFTDIYLDTFFPGHEDQYYELVQKQFYILLPCVFFWGFSSLLVGLLNINDEFRYSSFQGVFIPFSIIISLVFFKDYLGDTILAIGTLLGSILSFVYLLIISIYKNSLSISIPDFSNKNAKLMLKQIPAKVSSGLLTGLNGVVDQFFAAQLIIGSVAALNYGLKLPAFLIGILVVAISNVLLPHFSKLIIKNKEQAYQYYLKIVKVIFIGSGIFALLGILYSDFLIELLFQRNEFTAKDTLKVAQIQRAFLIYTPFAICGMVTVNFLTSMNKNKIMAYVSLFAVILNILLDYVLIDSFDVLGIAMSTTAVIILKNLLLFYFVLQYKD